jgi:hypothetical protein
MKKLAYLCLAVLMIGSGGLHEANSKGVGGPSRLSGGGAHGSSILNLQRIAEKAGRGPSFLHESENWSLRY